MAVERGASGAPRRPGRGRQRREYPSLRGRGAHDRCRQPELGRRRVCHGRCGDGQRHPVRRRPVRPSASPLQQPPRSQQRHVQHLHPFQPARRHQRCGGRRLILRLHRAELPRAGDSRAGLRRRDRRMPVAVRLGRRSAAAPGRRDDVRNRRALERGERPRAARRRHLSHRRAGRHLVHRVGFRRVCGVFREHRRDSPRGRGAVGAGAVGGARRSQRVRQLRLYARLVRCGCQHLQPTLRQRVRHEPVLRRQHRAARRSAAPRAGAPSPHGSRAHPGARPGRRA